ncbi:MAG: hypothetical protein JXA54_13560 [Candidatus Heimdallarchaeota archaeon]|nr:hypothetical protein [Candidatus Heimdallarchaeota archaeon]
MKLYSLVGKKLVECTPDELLNSLVGMLVDDEEEMIRLIVTPEANKKQRELLIQESADFNKHEYAGTYLVSHLENPDIVKTFLSDIKEGKDLSAKKEDLNKSKKKSKKGKEKEVEDQQDELESHILKRWDPELVKKAVNFLDGKPHASLIDIQEHLETTEGEAYWVTQDLIHVGTLPGRWIGYSDGQWFYQVIAEQPLSKEALKKVKKTTTPKPPTKEKGSAKPSTKKK